MNTVLQYQCSHPGCMRFFKSLRGRTKHLRSAHPILSPPLVPSPPASPIRSSCSRLPSHPPSQISDKDGWDREDFGPPAHSPPPDHPNPQEPPLPNENTQFFGPGDKYYWYSHPKLTGQKLPSLSGVYLTSEFSTGQPCDGNGVFLAPGTPLPVNANNPHDWYPYESQLQFETAKFLFSRCQMSAPKMDALLDLWASSLYLHQAQPPFSNHRHLYQTIDATTIGDVKWQCFSAGYTGEIPAVNPLLWMSKKYDVWFRDPRQPFEEYSTEDQTRQYKDFMSGEWAWEQADIISEDKSTHGSTFVPIILGSDKTTVLVATGNNEYYPLYMSVVNVHNNISRFDSACLIIHSLATKEHASDATFCKFRWQLFHSSLAAILSSLKPAMTTPKVVKFGDGHFRCVIYGLGPYIVDYEEQVLLTCIVCGWCPRCQVLWGNLDEDALDRSQAFTEALFEESTLDLMWDEYGIVGDLVPFTNDFPRADIYCLIAPDILHQLIKGCFKDHLVDWVTAYIQRKHSKREADQIMDDINRRIAAVAPFTGLRHFPQGQGFKQWTRDDSKALMKVYIAAIEGYVPAEIICTFHAFLEFCYLVHWHIISEKALAEIEDTLNQFHT
ncbi:hypothetical protein SCLCIDRAFT_18645 [Scleroderma citrinum Foug A]|uniref:C2H2-type domain-containing protein n=1 Tax=Scleroderma citrinum Foug A TaxID=1036808 RepID=A0A0C3ERT7_9AGAM|nr:hypothetical protein SCLCIDRAFT_18645 [Scleroderma citrinum Foug A]